MKSVCGPARSSNGGEIAWLLCSEACDIPGACMGCEAFQDF